MNFLFHIPPGYPLLHPFTHLFLHESTYSLPPPFTNSVPLPSTPWPIYHTLPPLPHSSSVHPSIHPWIYPSTHSLVHLPIHSLFNFPSTGGHVCRGHLHSAVLAPGSVPRHNRAAGNHSSVHCCRYYGEWVIFGELVGRAEGHPLYYDTPSVTHQCAKAIYSLSLTLIPLS